MALKLHMPATPKLGPLSDNLLRETAQAVYFAAAEHFDETCPSRHKALSWNILSPDQQACYLAMAKAAYVRLAIHGGAVATTIKEADDLNLAGGL